MSSVFAALKSCARETIGTLVAHKLRKFVNQQLISAIDLGYDPAQENTASALAAAIERSHTRIRARMEDSIALQALQDAQTKYEAEFVAALGNSARLKMFRGRDILSHFAGRYVNGMQYEYFRDLVISRMAEAGYKPAGMRKVVCSILGSEEERN